MVIEAIVEKLSAKQALFQQLDQWLPPEVPVCSNTSGLRITDISALCTCHPERTVTTHFWLPAHLVPLVEVVMGDKTDEAVAVQVRDELRRWKKSPVLVRRDLPGQLANRVFQAIIREAIDIVASGLASAEDVDTAIAAGMAGIISVMARFAFWFGGDRDDRRNNPLAGILMLVLTPLAAAVIQLAISRTREYMADFTGGQLSGDPDALADALEKIEGYARTRTMPRATEATAHMFIISPFSAKDAQAIFSTHPPTEKRIERLRQEAQEMRSRGMIDPVV